MGRYVQQGSVYAEITHFSSELDGNSLLRCLFMSSNFAGSNSAFEKGHLNSAMPLALDQRPTSGDAPSQPLSG